MRYIEINDTINDALVRVKSILNVLFYSKAAELDQMTVPTLMLNIKMFGRRTGKQALGVY